MTTKYTATLALIIGSFLTIAATLVSTDAPSPEEVGLVSVNTALAPAELALAETSSNPLIFLEAELGLLPSAQAETCQQASSDPTCCLNGAACEASPCCNNVVAPYIGGTWIQGRYNTCGGGWICGAAYYFDEALGHPVVWQTFGQGVCP